MSWKKFSKPVNSVLPAAQRNIDSTSTYTSTAKYSNWLPEVYSGPPDRLQRYAVYDAMNYDHEISAAVDTIADFGTECDEVSKLPLVIKFNDEPTPSEVQILEKSLGQWCRLNKMNRRLWRMFRSVLIYGDQFFLRDPETFKLYWIDPAKVEKVIVNESDGKKIESYFVKDIDLNMKSLVATNQLNKLSSAAFGSNSVIFSPPMQGNMNYVSGGYGGAGTSNYQEGGATAVDAEHIVQLSLTDGMNAAWPFGLSILEQIYKVYKQKELLEDAILIYRIHRAPERRVFFIDVGTMPPNKAQQYLERIRYEVQQKRIPSRTGGGCFSMDTKVPLLDGRILTLAELANEYNLGKENWAYSCNPKTGKMAPGLISWAGVTQASAKVMKITLDNGEEIICTPEHKFPIRGKGFVEAKDIIPNEDSFFEFNKTESLYNHRMVSIEYLDKNAEVGTLSIDSDEKYHNYHTFAINQGVYTKNSNVVDSTYNPMCLDMSTRIPLLDGRTLTIAELAVEYNAGKENWAYSADPISGKIVPGNITWAGVTRKNAKVIKLTLDNGEELVVTPDHKIPVFGKGFVEAKDLTIHDPLIPFMQHTLNDTQYTYDSSRESWIDTSYMVGNFFKSNNKHGSLIFDNRHEDSLKDSVHHADFNKLNNSPANIKWMNFNDRTTLNKFVIPTEWNSLTNDTRHAYLKKLHIDVNKYKSANIPTTEKNTDIIEVKKSEQPAYITSIEYMDQLQDVGTITIDGKETWHNHHTFAVESGIFVKNSILEDYFFAVTCLSLSTQVPLLDGRTITLQDCINEFTAGKENYTYTVNQDTQEMIPGKIVWGGVTRKNAEVVEVKLDNDEIIRCTPDHRFIMRDGSEVEAKDLVSGSSLMPLYLKPGKTSNKQKGNPYMRYIDNATGKVKWVHTTVCPKTKTGKDVEIHHIDFNSLNNSPTNLCEMTSIDHRSLHKAAGTYSIGKQWSSVEGREKLLAGMHAIYANRTDELNLMLSSRNSINGNTINTKRHTNENIVHLKTQQKLIADKKKIRYTIAAFTRVDELVKSGFDSISKLIKCLRDDTKFQSIISTDNPNIKRDNDCNIFKPNDLSLNKIVLSAGFNSWGDYKASLTGKSKFSNKKYYNHKVVSVTFLADREDTGDITIESEGGYHNFAVAAGVYVHNSEGRGSKVEVLPGGENLGDIDDLRYFNNKMLRALGVPSSYLPTGPEDGTAAVNDGRVGTAFIQEFRFSKVVARYQQQIIDPLDSEFKLFLKFRGITIDSSLFEIDFTPPQSFSEYRQLELDSARINTFSALTDISFVSKRFILKTYLGWSEEQLAENERMWKEERSRLTKTFAPEPSNSGASSGLSDVGITSSGIDDMAPDDTTGTDTGIPQDGDTNATDTEVDNFGNQ